ncbi:MAG: class III poly(R)-hydroxyalkanoic acid synthase subunit PhaE, partial [Stenotrophomonas sp.]
AGGPDLLALLERLQHDLGPWLQSPAFGPAREHQARWQALLRAQQEYQGHARDYVDQIKQALDDAFNLFEQRLAEHEQPGNQLTSARAMFDLWIEAAEEAYAKVAMSEPFQQVYAALGNAQMRLRAGAQQEVERFCEAAGMPTRTEMDAAHRRITELERLVRRMAAGAAQPAPVKPSRAGAEARSDAGDKVRKAPAKPAKAASAAKPAKNTKAAKAAEPAKPAKPAKSTRPRARKAAP